MMAQQEWEKLKLGDVLEKIVGGGTPSKSEPAYWGGTIPWASVKDMEEGVYRLSSTIDSITEEGLSNSSSNLIPKGTVVTSTRMGLGRCFIAKVDVAINQDLKALFPNGKIAPEYLLWLLSSVGHKLASMGTGTTVKGIRLEQLRDLDIAIPSIATQVEIASILSAYDDLIENNTRRIKILEEMAQSLYREWFINFRFPGHKKVKMVDSPLGKIPFDWEVKQLGDVIELVYGKALRADNRIPGRVPVYGSGGVVGWHNESLAEGPGIIVGRKGNVGSVYWSDGAFYPIDTVFYVNSKISLYYCFYNLQHQNFLNSDAAVPGLSRKFAYLLPILIPSEDMLEQFKSFIMPIFDQLKTLRGSINNLHSTRDLLLPKLMSGQVGI